MDIFLRILWFLLFVISAVSTLKNSGSITPAEFQQDVTIVLLLYICSPLILFRVYDPWKK